MPSSSARLPRWLLTGPLHTWADLEANPLLPPASAGVYAWWFKDIPKDVPTVGCCQRADHYLLYVGISPSSRGGTETLRSRIRYHFRGNAEGSTLRLTLGCLLEPRLGTVLRRVGAGRRRTFSDREADLASWMAENATVAWRTMLNPWVGEADLISSLSLPLNLDQNNSHPFAARLRIVRSEARRRADALPRLSA